MANASNGDAIKVLAGAYDVGAGEVFPIDIKDGVEILGQEASPSAFPQIGGDLIGQSSTATSLFLVDATAGSRETSIIALKFLGEDEASADSPVALIVSADDGNAVELQFQENICTRPHQNATQENGLATLSFLVTNAEVGGSIWNNTIETSDRGGVEFVAWQDDASGSTYTSLTLKQNYIVNPEDDTALFGVRWHAVDKGVSTLDMGGIPTISGNTVRARTGGIWNGIEIICEEHTTFNHLTFDGNAIEGCSNHGLVLEADGWDPNDNKPEIALTSFKNNQFFGNGGSGLLAVWDQDSADDGLGYIHIIIGQNLFADNGRYGIELKGVGSATGSTSSEVKQVNSTIVNNELGAMGFGDLQFDTDPPAELAGVGIEFSNCIVYGNGAASTAQIAGLSSQALRDVVLQEVSYSDWEGIRDDSGNWCVPVASESWNIDCDPEFLTWPSARYHLATSPLSPCIDIGSNTAAAVIVPALDFDGEERIQDGDYDCECECDPVEVIDLGYDEVPQRACEG